MFGSNSIRRDLQLALISKLVRTSAPDSSQKNPASKPSTITPQSRAEPALPSSNITTPGVTFHDTYISARNACPARRTSDKKKPQNVDQKGPNE